ncbi:MAG: fumarylacetoacetate hydrolase family protein [Gemmataceae bacterium]|nr:fumarylacetoacetate hydrolase family protein [Gemmataceae bacterium]
MPQLCKVRLESGEIRPAILDGDKLQPLAAGRPTLTDLLHGADPLGQARKHVDAALGVLPLHRAMLVAPIDQQEVWAAGVTYKRSEEARKRESVGAAQFYDLVYSAARPELFFKSPAWRVSGPGERVHIRRDARWSVPEPELALVISPELKLVGFTIGNDMSSRDIEGENPLYLPQAKFYDHACALGPAITLVADMPAPDAAVIRVTIERGGAKVFEGDTKVSAIKRSFEELIGWLGRETSFPHGAILLTGTGIVPADTFTLAVGDIVHIDVTGIGRLTNVVQQRA